MKNEEGGEKLNIKVSYTVEPQLIVLFFSVNYLSTANK